MIFLGVKILIPAYNDALYDSISSKLTYSAKQLEHSLDNALSLSNMILADSSIQDNLDLLRKDTPLNLRTYNALYNTIQSYYIESNTPIISHISLLSANNHIQSYPLADTLPYKVQQHINNLSIDANGASIWITDYCQEYGLFLSRTIRKIHQLDLTCLGILTFTIDLEPILDSTFDTDTYSDAYYLLYDSDNLIYRSSNLPYDIPDTLYSDMSTPYNLITLGKHRYFVVSDILSQYGWHYVILINSSNIKHSIHVACVIYLILVFLCFLLNIFLCHILLKPLVSHLNYLILRMKQFGSSKDLRVEPQSIYSSRTDEIGMLHQQFYSMATEIQELIKFNYLGS